MKNKLVALILLIAVFICGCSKGSTEPVNRTEMLLGTICSIRLYDKKDTIIFDKAFDRIRQLEEMVSANKNGTEIDTINLNAGLKPVQVSEETYYLIERGLEYGEISNGDLDITIGAVTALWNIGFSDAKVPEKSEIDKNLAYINMKDVELDENAKTVFLKQQGMKLDLGAIAKGYIADEIVELLKENGVKSGIIDLGGNVVVIGSKAGTPWRVGVQDPVKERNEIIGLVRVADKSIVTSGIYERYIVGPNGTHYHHLLDPANGYPFENELAGVTIISNMSIDGDGLSTTVFARGLQNGLALVEQLPDVDAVFVTKDNTVYISSGLKDNFELSNKSYKLMN